MTQPQKKTFRLRLDQVEELAQDLLRRFGYEHGLASTIAQLIREAEHNGLPGHGLAMLGRYKLCAESGRINLAPRPRARISRPGLMVLDCDDSFASHALKEFRQSFIDSVRRQGVASVVTQNAHHLSALGLDILPLAEAGFIALIVSGTLPWVVPHGGTRPILGTNPMSFAFPRAGAPPVVWDQAVSIRSVSDIQVAQRSGERLDKPVGLNLDGDPTSDPNEILESRKLLPFAEHKGTAIALMIEVLAAGLSGGNFAANYSAAKNGSTNPAGQFLLAIDPGAVTSNFTDHIDFLLREFDSNGEARIPGDGRLRRQRHAEEEGITIPSWLAETFQLYS